MKPWDWLASAEEGFGYVIMGPGGATWRLTDADRRYIVAACLAFTEGTVCKTCGGLSWDVPLEDYCTCKPGVKPKAPCHP